MPRFIRLKNNKNITFDSKTNVYYFEQQIDGRRKQWSTGVKGVIEVKEENGRLIGLPKKGLALAKIKVHEFQSRLQPNKLGRPKFKEAFDISLDVQSSKSKRTFIVAKDGDKNLRPFFLKEVPYLDNFVKNYEFFWAEYIKYAKNSNPDRKLEHDRKYLIFVLRRALKKGMITFSFTKSDFPLNEVTNPIGKALSDKEVKSLLENAEKFNNDRLYLQILMAVTMGMRKGEILSLELKHIDLFNREIDLDPKNLKIRRKRFINIPVSDSVFPGLLT